MVEHRSPKPRVVGSSPSLLPALKTRGRIAKSRSAPPAPGSAEPFSISKRQCRWRRPPQANSSGRSAAKRRKVVWPTWNETVRTGDHGPDHDRLARALLLRGRFVLQRDRPLPARPDRLKRQQGTTKHMSRWYIIHAYSGFENKVKDAILSEATRLASKARSRRSRSRPRRSPRSAAARRSRRTASSSPATSSPSSR